MSSDVECGLELFGAPPWSFFQPSWEHWSSNKQTPHQLRNRWSFLWPFSTTTEPPPPPMPEYRNHDVLLFQGIFRPRSVHTYSLEVNITVFGIALVTLPSALTESNGIPGCTVSEQGSVHSPQRLSDSATLLIYKSLAGESNMLRHHRQSKSFQ
jgi:hypothetical protein